MGADTLRCCEGREGILAACFGVMALGLLARSCAVNRRPVLENAVGCAWVDEFGGV